MPAGIGERLSDVTRASAAQTRVAPAVQSGLGQVQETAASYRGRSWMHGGDLVKHPGWQQRARPFITLAAPPLHRSAAGTGPTLGSRSEPLGKPT